MPLQPGFGLATNWNLVPTVVLNPTGRPPAPVAVHSGTSAGSVTVFNYFPTKEALILDRWQVTTESLRTGLDEPGSTPVEAALRILDEELGGMTAWLDAQEDPVRAGALVMRFGALIRSTPSLRAHQHDAADRLVVAAAEALARRAGLEPDDPEPRIAAAALLELWRIQFQSLGRHLDGSRTPAQVHQAVTADVRRAARLIDAGLRTFGG
jgi:AcrR family transcriptional regulator